MPPPAQTPTPIKDAVSFGPFTLSSGERLLTRDGAPVELQGRAFDILLALVARPNEVVSKQELMTSVWPDVTVEEGSLRFHIANLRKALGDGKDGARYITTESGRGYCFVAPVSRSDEPPQKAAKTGFRHANLPARPLGMFGRDNDLQKLPDRLHAARFVTIVGAGGVGKTTVAVATGHQLLEDFAGAALFVDLSMVSDAALAPTVVASMLGLSVQSDDATPTLIGYLRDKRILLILDTCEHLIEAVAALTSQIFAAAPQVHILATSREALRVDGEQVYRLEPLACPPDDAALTAADASTFPAIQLFLERARASGAQLEFSDTEAAIVVGICRKLDGVALAIELAARRVEAYGVHQTAALLDQRLTLLWVGPRTAPPRQKTLHATLDWSYGLLTEVERTVLRRLAVFVGHFSLDAALAVVAEPDLDQPAIFNAIDSLVAKSMIATRPVGAMMRYRLLDTTRAYAREIDIGKTETSELAARHATYFRQWLEQSGTEWTASLTGAERAPYFANLNNVRAALEWCFGAEGDRRIGVGLAAAAARVFRAMFLLPECHRWSRQAVGALDDASRGGIEEMHLQTGLGLSSMFTMGNSEHAHAALMRALELAEKFHDTVNQLRIIDWLHMFHSRAGHFDQVRAFAERGEAVAAESGDPVNIAAAHVLLGAAHHLTGHQIEARSHVEKALAMAPSPSHAKARGFASHHQRAHIVLARTLWLLGYPDQAARLARRIVDGLAAAEATTTCLGLIWGAWVFRWIGDVASAGDCIDRLISHADRQSLTPYLAVGNGLKGEMMIRQGQMAGVDLLRGSLATLRAEQFELYAAELKSSLAQGLAMMGRHDQALATLDQALAGMKENGELSMPELLRVRGGIVLSMPDHNADDAEACLRESLDLSRRQGALGWELRTATDLAKLQADRGKPKDGQRLLEPIYARFTEGFETADLKAARNLLSRLA
jgi:predicted ATPase/DNA-binding winged helix-turn-helix (wHTH) protein